MHRSLGIPSTEWWLQGVHCAVLYSFCTIKKVTLKMCLKIRSVSMMMYVYPSFNRSLKLPTRVCSCHEFKLKLILKQVEEELVWGPWRD